MMGSVGMALTQGDPKVAIMTMCRAISGARYVHVIPDPGCVTHIRLGERS